MSKPRIYRKRRWQHSASIQDGYVIRHDCEIDNGPLGPTWRTETALAYFGLLLGLLAVLALALVAFG